MPKVDNKYIQHFQKLTTDWNTLLKNPNSDALNMLMKDLQQFQQDLRNMRL